MLRCKKVSSPSQPHKEVVYRTCSHKNHNEAISSAPRSTLQSTRDQSSLTRDVTQTQQLDNKVWNSWPIHRTFLCGFLQKRVININFLLLISLRHQKKRLGKLIKRSNLYVDIDQMLEGLTILDQHFCKDHFNVHKINFVIALLLQAVLYNRLKTSYYLTDQSDLSKAKSNGGPLARFFNKSAVK